MQLVVQHTTTYDYSAPARSNINELKLAPDQTNRQIPGDHLLKIFPNTEISTSRDLFGNLVHQFEVEERHQQLTISSEAHATTSDQPELIAAAFDQQLNLDDQDLDEWSYSFLSDSNYVKVDPDLWRQAIDIQQSAAPTWGGLLEHMSNTIFDICTYRDQIIHSVTTASEVNQTRTGTCQDFTHLMLGYLRALKIPARYCSGYFHDPGLDQGNAEYLGAEYSHAWVEAMVPQVGWIGIDPTNQRWVDQLYISVAFGRDYSDVSPIRGSLIGGGDQRSIDVRVTVTQTDK
ncbi:MAG: transglutaminase family protein [Verrucomicrobiota bacterium]